MWNLRSDRRLSEWRKFRNGLRELSLDEAIKSTTHLWSYAPFVNRYLEIDRPEQWPDPWVLLDENIYCDVAKALGMLYTIYLSEHESVEDITLQILVDTDGNYNNIVQINKRYILNYWHDEVVNTEDIDKELKLLYEYSPVQLGMNKYQ